MHPSGSQDDTRTEVFGDEEAKLGDVHAGGARKPDGEDGTNEGADQDDEDGGNTEAKVSRVVLAGLARRNLVIACAWREQRLDIVAVQHLEFVIVVVFDESPFRSEPSSQVTAG